jgi:cytochrome c-type biogenesis protein CcmH
MMKSCLALLAALLVTFATGAFAIDTERAFDDPQLQARYEKLNRELRCLVCQNQTIADSNATLAADLRREVRDLIAQGKSDEDIREFMIERYGDFVLYRPRMTATNFLLWAAPVLLLLVGLIAAVRVIRKRAADTDTDSGDPEASSK